MTSTDAFHYVCPFCGFHLALTISSSEEDVALVRPDHCPDCECPVTPEDISGEDEGVSGPWCAVYWPSLTTMGHSTWFVVNREHREDEGFRTLCSCQREDDAQEIADHFNSLEPGA